MDNKDGAAAPQRPGKQYTKRERKEFYQARLKEQEGSEKKPKEEEKSD